MKRSAKRESGFIISLEFLLILALVVFPLMLALILLGRKITTLYLNQLAFIEQPLTRPVVWDSAGTAKPVGAVIGYDRFEAPLILYRDASTGLSLNTVQYQPGVLLGVRPNRFTTLSKVYYDGANCAGTPYVKSSTNALAPWPDVGYIAQMQGINYAVGSGNILYRTSVPVVPLGSLLTGSVWTSLDTGDESPATGGTSCVALPAASVVNLFFLADGGGPVATAVTPTSHNLRSGDRVVIVSTIPSPITYSGTFVVTVTSPNTFTYRPLAASTFSVTLPGPDIRLFTNTAAAVGVEPYLFSTTAVANLTTTTSNFVTANVNVVSTNTNWATITAAFATLTIPVVLVGSSALTPFVPPLALAPIPNVTATFVRVEDLVEATVVADLDNPATNFTRPFRISFPAPVPVTAGVGTGTGG